MTAPFTETLGRHPEHTRPWILSRVFRFEEDSMYSPTATSSLGTNRQVVCCAARHEAQRAAEALARPPRHEPSDDDIF